MYKVEKIVPEVYNGVGYKLTLMKDFEDFRNRLIIKLDKPISSDTYNKLYENVQKDFNPEIYELSPSIKLGDFLGYNNVLLTHNELQYIINKEEPEWKNALSNVTGINCITDTSTGKLYIGSASGDSGGIWQRWSSYANIQNLTGGNKTFEELKNDGADYIIDNFTYSILEVFDKKTERHYIYKREEFWKKVFQSVKFGMNNARTNKQE